MILRDSVFVSRLCTAARSQTASGRSLGFGSRHRPMTALSAGERGAFSSLLRRWSLALNSFFASVESSLKMPSQTCLPRAICANTKPSA